MKLNILFLNYWSLSDGLTSATVYPNAAILNDIPGVRKIVITSYERNKNVFFDLPSIPNSIFKIFRARYVKIISDILFLIWLFKLTKSEKINVILCKGAVAGGFGFCLSKLAKVKFFVESFEPHSMYMLEGKCWSRFGFKFNCIQFLEKKQLNSASGIITVTKNFSNKLIETGSDSKKIFVSPCPVDPSRFDSSKNKSTRRKQAGLEDKWVGVCIGKFGGLYMENEIFLIFLALASQYSNFRLIWLVKDTDQKLTNRINELGLADNLFFIGYVEPNKVAEFIALSNFGICNVKPGFSKQYQCPIKNGEYWAGGLPILLPDNIGDDSSIVDNYGVGACFSDYEKSLQRAAEHIRKLSNEKDIASRCENVARLKRSFTTTQQNYQSIFKMRTKIL
jgi:glycosyltransferase involved in cell wall biosynthesis